MDVSEFVVAARLPELTRGPKIAYLATLSLTRGQVPGLVATVGVAFGLAVLIQRCALIYEALRWFGIAYLLFLAWEGWQTQAELAGPADLRRTAGPPFLCGFQSNVFNPKSNLLRIRGPSVRGDGVRHFGNTDTWPC